MGLTWDPVLKPAELRGDDTNLMITFLDEPTVRYMP